MFAASLGLGCFGNYEDRIRIDGSSTLFPLSEAVAEDFRKAHSGIKITVGVSGTSGGIRKFIRNEIDIADASRKMNSLEIKECEKNNISFIEIPVSNDGIVIAVNPENTFVNYLTVAELKKIWEPSAQKRIMYWDQIRGNWPHKAIQLFGAGTSSGSFDFFTLRIVGIKKATRGDYTASEDDNMLVQGVKGAKYSLGYFGYSYYKENANDLKLIPICTGTVNDSLLAILPSEKTIQDRSYQPLSRTEYLYINSKALQKPIVKDFVLYYLKNAENLLNEIGGVPLTKEEYKNAIHILETSLP